MKKILLFPVRNEEWILEQTLPAASLWADHIIVADHNSSDATPDILRRFPKVSIIQNTNEFHTSTIRRELLAEAPFGAETAAPVDTLLLFRKIPEKT
jgi:glycosyltransferase involved in cell wall biosynthesis